MYKNILLLVNVVYYDDVCVAEATKELCEAGNTGHPQIVDSNQLNSMINLLCTK